MSSTPTQCKSLRTQGKGFIIFGVGLREMDPIRTFYYLLFGYQQKESLPHLIQVEIIESSFRFEFVIEERQQRSLSIVSLKTCQVFIFVVPKSSRSIKMNINDKFL